LLDGVHWEGAAIPGERLGDLLSALALRPSGASDQALVEEIWADEMPANPTKALQVLVSRVRSACGPGVVERYDGGYRLRLDRGDVDVWLVADLTAAAERAVAAGDAGAVDLAARAEALLAGAADTDPADGPRGRLMQSTRALESRVRRVRGLALAARGDAAGALPLLLRSHAEAPDDVATLAALLRAEAAAVGVAAALQRFERYRVDLAERLGVDPPPALQRLHGELLAADDPVRTGLRWDTEELLGRSGDLDRIRTAMASGRLTTILGPGGIGKTSTAHVLARESTLPRVQVVELVGVSSGDDVVAEVGAALGVRGSVTSHRTLTPRQQADVRGRIAQELDAGPALLVLDNCEHVLETVAALVAFLLVTTRDLRVLTTSRAPLRIAAERVVPLSQLGEDDAADLFVRRARAVRPDVDLPGPTVAAVVDRLDGLPLAIELAAARVRTMSVEEVRRALDDRFGLLRSRDRAAPERHRTLTAVIAWSWDLLTPPQQRALAWLSVFHDGVSADDAVAVLGPDGRDLVEDLVDHSLLGVVDGAGATRFRALETIREFAAARLGETGDTGAALAAQDAWAVALVQRHASPFFGSAQMSAVDALMPEENNLTDVLRRALLRGDAGLVVRLFVTLGSLWTITGNHPRVFAVADAAEETLAGWDPPEELRATAQEAAALLLLHLSWIPDRPSTGLRAAMERWGEPRTSWARAAWAMFVMDDDRSPAERMVALADAEDDGPDRAMLLLWASIFAENAGDVDAAAAHARLGLGAGPLSPYLEASLHAQLSQLTQVAGDHHASARHAEVAWPLLLRLHAVDDAHMLRVGTALGPLLDGDPDTCERILDEVEQAGEGAQLGSRMALRAARAELALARGQVAEGLGLYDDAVAEADQQDMPGMGGATPWLALAAAASLVARVHHEPPGPSRRADELRSLLVQRTGSGVSGRLAFQDFPLNGVLLVALGAHALRFGPASTHDAATRLLAVAHRWAYNRSLPTMAWPRLVELADRVRPGRLAELTTAYADRPAADLVPLVEDDLRVVTSSG
jgi:predicted ATPase/DNA-binding SARP family transcriptional activator